MPKNDRTLKFFDFFRYCLHPPVNISRSYLHKRGLYHSKIIQIWGRGTGRVTQRLCAMEICPALRILRKRKWMIFKQNQLEMNPAEDIQPFKWFYSSHVEVLKSTTWWVHILSLIKTIPSSAVKGVWVWRKAYNAALAVKQALNWGDAAPSSAALRESGDGEAHPVSM